MKQFFTLALSFFFIASSFAQVTAVKSGNWTDDNTWSTKMQPATGEDVIIPDDLTVEVAENLMTSADLNVKIFGTLKLNQGKLRIGNNSIITIYPKGRLVPAQGNGGEKIEIGNTEQYTGLQGTLTGPMVASKSTSGFQSFAMAALPVKFTQFSVATQNNNVLVQWSTAEEQDAAYFEVQRSTNGADWNAIGQVAAAGNSNRLTQYTFTDKNKLAGTVYYRIKQADINGKAAYTPVQSIRSQAAAQVAIVAYQSGVSVQFGQQVKGKVAVLVVNRAGQVVARQNFESPVGNVMLNTASLKGNFFVSIQSAAGVTASKQVVL